MSLNSKLESLPASQRALWPELREISDRFVLYGGTALALRLGHRVSEDFDLFGRAPVAPEQLLESCKLLAGATVRQKALNTLTVSVQRPGPVKVSFFGVQLGRVDEPEWTNDGVLRVAGLRDIAGCKMAVIQTRPEAKDYLDIYALLSAGVRLETMLGAAQAIYGPQFHPMISLKALAWFGDGDLGSLPEEVGEALRKASAQVSGIENLHPLPGGVVPAGG
jgi:hypothetical protein